MQKFTEKKFNIPALKGISAKNIEEHIKLYAGYVKNANLVIEKITDLSQKDAEKYSYEISELQRRFSFEFNGIINHQYYFRQFEGEARPISNGSVLREMIEKTFGSFDLWLGRFKALSATRGIGWAMLYFDPETKQLLNAWVDEQHLGQLNGCRTILALDMWEHSYVADYAPSGKKQYIEDFFANLNWSVPEKNLSEKTE